MPQLQSTGHKVIVNKIRKIARTYDRINTALHMGRFKKTPTTNPTVAIIGHDRSGTSWVGKTISFGEKVVYFYEPLNPKSNPNGNWDGWNQYLTKEDESPLYQHAFKHPKEGLPMGLFTRPTIRKRLSADHHIVIKDVGSIMAVEWLEKYLNAKVLLVLRHPYPVIQSNLKQGSYGHRWLESIRTQKKLMDGPLAPFAKLLQNPESENDAIILAWMAKHRLLSIQLEEGNSWETVFYEDLCMNPMKEFEKLCCNLGIPFDQSIKNRIRESTQSNEDVHAYSTKRDSKAMATKWKTNCDLKLLERIHQLNLALEIPWYTDQSFWRI